MIPETKIFIDSGAFSTKSYGLPPQDIQDYITFIKKHEHNIHVYANLDVIGDAEATWYNQKMMEKAGLSPLPVFHPASDDIKWLHKCINEYEYFAIGGVAHNPSITTRINVLDKCWHMLVDQDGKPTNKVHGFGLAAPKLIFRYPWYCMTEEDHEVLTKTGWKNRQTLSIGEEILAFDKGNMQWEKVLEIPTFPVQNINMSVLQNRNFYTKVTDNHKWITSKKLKYQTKWEFKNTKDLVGSRIRIPRIGNNYTFPKEKKYDDNFLDLLAWFWTDGTINKRPRYRNKSITIYQSKRANPDKCILIEKTLQKCKEAHCVTISKKSKTAAYRMYGNMTQQLLNFAPNKKLPLNFIFDLTKEQLQRFITISVLADGTHSKLVRRRGFTIAVTKQIKKDNLEILRIGCLLLSIPTSISFGNKNTKCLQASSVDYIYPGNLRKHMEKYTGNIWCVRVKSKAFIVKSKNHIYVTGNSIDTSSYMDYGQYGMIIMPKKTVHGYNYNTSPVKVFCTARSPKRAKDGTHFDNLTKSEQKAVLEYLKIKNIEYGTSEFREVEKGYKPEKGVEVWFNKERTIIEKPIIEGISNTNFWRDTLNYIYYMDIAEATGPFEDRRFLLEQHSTLF